MIAYTLWSNAPIYYKIPSWPTCKTRSHKWQSHVFSKSIFIITLLFFFLFNSSTSSLESITLSKKPLCDKKKSYYNHINFSLIRCIPIIYLSKLMLLHRHNYVPKITVTLALGHLVGQTNRYTIDQNLGRYKTI